MEGQEIFVGKEIFVGIDVSKANLDVAIHGQHKTYQFPQTKAGIQSLVKLLSKLEPTLVVLEATGGLEREVSLALGREEIPISIINPRKAREFARAIGQSAKTDAVDARVLAHLAQALKPAITQLPEEDQLALHSQRRTSLPSMLSRTGDFSFWRCTKWRRIDSSPAPLPSRSRLRST